MTRLLPLLLLTACDGEQPAATDTTPADTDPPSPPTTDTDPPAATGDTGPTDTGVPYVGPVVIESASFACDADQVFTFTVGTIGWTLDGVVYAQETANYPPAQWSENFTVESYEHDPDGAWDHLRHSLETGASVGAWQPNVNTVFTCFNHFNPANAVMSYAVAVYDETDTLADCIAWGENPQGMIDGTAGNNVNAPMWDLAPCVVGETPY